MTGTPKILLYTDESTAGGVAHYNHALLAALAARGGPTCSAQPPHDSPLLDEQRRLGIAHFFLSYEPRLTFTRSFTDTADPERIITGVAPDLIFFSDCSPLSNLAAKHVAITRNIPYVVLCHSGAGYLAGKFPACLGLVRKQNNFARQVIAISDRSLAILRETFGLGPDKGLVIGNGRPAAFFAPPDPAVRTRLRHELELPAGAILCFTSARFDAGKGYQHLFGAIKALHDCGKLGPLHFAWAGTGDLHAQFTEAIGAAGLAARIRLLGQRWDIADLLDASDMFALATLNEGGLPLAAMEAMAKGVPTLITAVSGIPEIVGRAARLLPDPNTDPVGTATEFARAALELAGDPALRAALGRAGKQLAEKSFHQDINLRQTLAVIDSSLAASAPAPGDTKSAQPPAPDPRPDQSEAILVSAIVSTYKSEKFIAGCLEDLVGQTLFAQGKLEIVVVDSCSPENEGAIVRSFQARHPNIVYLRTPERETLYAAWNRGIELARGRYVTNANTDDRHRANALELQALALEDQPGAALVYGDCYLSTTPNERFADNARSRKYQYPDFFAPAALLHYQLGPQPMWRKSVHATIGLFDGTMRAAGDYDFNLRFARKFTALHLPVALGSYLAHAGAISFADDSMQRETQLVAGRYQTDETIEALYAQAGISAVTAAEKSRIHLDLGLRASEFYPPWNEGRPEANPALAAKCYLRAMELDPHQPHAVNNLFCLLAWSGRKADALTLIQRFPALADTPVFRANIERVRQPSFSAAQGGSLSFMSSGLGLPGQRQLSTGMGQPVAIAS